MLFRSNGSFMADENQNPFECESRFDATIENAAIGLGGSRDKMAQTTVGNANRLSWREKQELFDGDWLIRRICAILPQKVQESGWELKLGDKENDRLVEEMKTYVRNLFSYSNSLSALPNIPEYPPDRALDNPRIASVESLFTKAQVAANAEDGCVIFINLDDGREPSHPIDPKGIKSVIGLELLRRREIRPAWEYDRNAEDPTFYQLMLEKGGKLLPESTGALFIHRSRILRFDGLEQVSDMKLKNNEGWTGSIIDTIWDDFKTWRVAYSASGNTLSDGSLFVYMLRGMRELIASGKESYLQKRVQVMANNMSQLGGIGLDMNDESVQFQSRQYGGMEQLLRSFLDVVVAATGLPHTIVLGESPSGLGATGESEQRAIEDAKRELFEGRYFDKLNYLYKLFFLAKDSPTRGKEPKDWQIEYKGGYNPTQVEALANLNSFIMAASGAIAAGFMTPDEARASFSGTTPRLEFILDDKAWQKQKAEQEAQQMPDQFGGGYGAEQGQPQEQAQVGTGEQVPGQGASVAPDGQQQSVQEEMEPENLDEIFSKAAPQQEGVSSIFSK